MIEVHLNGIDGQTALVSLTVLKSSIWRNE